MAEQGKPSLLSLRGLTRRFGGLTAVDGIDLDLAKGDLVSIIGPNGAGKTTLFNLVTGLDRPDAGEVRLDGQVVTGHSPEKLAANGLARTFQLGRVFGNLSVMENVLIGAHTRLRAVRPATPLDRSVAGIGIGAVATGFGKGRGRTIARRGEGHPGAVWRASAAAHRSAGLQPVLRQSPPCRDRARAGAEAAFVAARRADGRHESDRDDGDAGTDRRTEGRRADDPADRAQARHWSCGSPTASSSWTKARRSPKGAGEDVRNDAKVIEAYLGHGLSQSAADTRETAA